MNGKAMMWLWSAVLVAFLAGSGWVGWKLWKRQKAQALAEANKRWEVSISLPLKKELNADELGKMLEAENERLDRYEVLRPVIDELDLVTFWGVEGADAAMEQLKESTGFRRSKQSGEVLFVATDKDKEMAGKMGGAVWKSYQGMVRRERYLLPQLPASTE